MACAVAKVFLTVIAVAAAQGDVVELSSSNFDSHIRTNKQTLVQFHAPWCGHCKKLVPEYEKAAQQLKASKGIALAKIDATAEKSIATKYNVKGFPTMLWFEDGKDTPYDGGKTTETIVEWVVSMVGIPVTETALLPAADGLKPLVVLTGPSLVAGFENAAKANRRTAAWYFIKQAGAAKVEIHHKGEAPVQFSGDAGNSEKVSAFVKQNILPLFGSLDGDSWNKYMSGGKGIVWTLFDEQDVGQTRRPMMSDVASSIKDRFWVTYTDVTHPQSKEPVENMLAVKDFPAIGVQKKAGDKKKYVYSGEMTAEKIKQFIRDVEADRVKPHLRTEPDVPIDPNAPVKTLVSTSFEREVFDNAKDVLLFIGAPWCGHCKKLDPEYQKLAKKIQDEAFDGYFKITKMDGTLNDSPVDSFDWTSFPSVYFVRAGQKEHMLYEGERTAKGLWKYLRRHATKATEIHDIIEKRKAAQKRASEL